jgi:2-methylcitrate dehydratase PrpD
VSRNATSALAAFALGLRAADLRGTDDERLRLLIVDHLAAAFAGATTATARAVRSFTVESSRRGTAAVIGSPHRCTPAAAAFANAVAAHAAELDDTHEPTLTHPGAVVIAAALAVADESSEVDEVLTAILAGYEVMTRIAAACNAARVARNGFHPTAVFGGFGAAAAVARICKLPLQQLLAAWGIVLSRAGGSMQFADEPHGGEVKPLHAGFAAESGVIAVELARRGLATPLCAIDGRYGIGNLFARGVTEEAIMVHRPFAIHSVALKLYPSCRMLHAAIEAVLACLSADARSPCAIARITVGGPSKLADQHMQHDPHTPTGARYSLPYAVAAAIDSGPESLQPFDNVARPSPAILALAQRVTAIVDAEAEARFPNEIGSSAIVTFADGTSRCASIRNARGSPLRPLDAATVFAKFERCAALLMPDAPQVRIAISQLRVGFAFAGCPGVPTGPVI